MWSASRYRHANETDDREVSELSRHNSTGGRNTGMAEGDDKFIERIVILDRHAFGVKVMDWSAGRLPVPTTLEEAEEQLSGILQFPLPSYIIGLQFIQTTKEVWTIKLPPRDMLQDTRDRIAAGEEYVLPAFYKMRVDNPDSIPNDRLFECRVGDYTCSLCT